MQLVHLSYLPYIRKPPAKDIPNLLRAFAIIADKYASVKLFLVGDGELRLSMESLVSSMGLESSVVFAGRRLDVVSFYSMADCFVLPSAWEGFGMVLVEAMSCELPVITTDAGGCAEIVPDKRFVVPVNNSEKLAQCMENMMKLDADDLNALKESNLKYSDRFSLEKIANQWESIYNEGLKM